MAIERTRSRRKVSGGRYIDNRKARQHAVMNSPIMTHIGEEKIKEVRARSGVVKQKLLKTNKISVASGKTVKLATLTRVVENKADKNLEVRNILTKGAIVETNLGNVRITSRPGQTGALTGVLVKE